MNSAGSVRNTESNLMRLTCGTSALDEVGLQPTFCDSKRHGAMPHAEMKCAFGALTAAPDRDQLAEVHSQRP